MEKLKMLVLGLVVGALAALLLEHAVMKPSKAERDDTLRGLMGQPVQNDQAR